MGFVNFLFKLTVMNRGVGGGHGRSEALGAVIALGYRTAFNPLGTMAAALGGGPPASGGPERAKT